MAIILLFGSNDVKFIDKLKEKFPNNNIGFPKDYVLIQENTISHYNSMQEVSEKVGLHTVLLRPKNIW